jgi:hypothetical protein
MNYWPSPNLYSNISPTTPLPTSHLDPPQGGYTYQTPPNVSLGYPYYYDPSPSATGVFALSKNETNAGKTLQFYDRPINPDLLPGEQEVFSTYLVGITGGDEYTPLYDFVWTSTYNPGTGGGIAVSSSYPGFDDVSGGVGGISILSEGPVSTPEPSTWAMMLIGFVGLGYAGYRRTSAPRH